MPNTSIEEAEKLALKVADIIFNRKPGWSVMLKEACRQELLLAKRQGARELWEAVKLERIKVSNNVEWIERVGYNQALSDLETRASQFFKERGL